MEVNRFHHKAAQKESCEKEKLGFHKQISGFTVMIISAV